MKTEDFVGWLHEHRLFLRPTNGGATKSGRLRTARAEAQRVFSSEKLEQRPVAEARAVLLASGLVCEAPKDGAA